MHIQSGAVAHRIACTVAWPLGSPVFQHHDGMLQPGRPSAARTAGIPQLRGSATCQQGVESEVRDVLGVTTRGEAVGIVPEQLLQCRQ